MTCFVVIKMLFKIKKRNALGRYLDTIRQF